MKEGPPINRKTVAIASFALAALALVAMIAALRPVLLWRPTWPRSIHIGSISGVTFTTAPGKSASRTVPATGVKDIVIDATLGDVSLSAAPSDKIDMHWTIPDRHPEKALQTSLQGNVLTITFSPPSVVGVGQNGDRLVISVPKGIAVDAHVDAGAMTATGTYDSLTATLQAGALNVQNFQGSLSAHDNLGAIDVSNATIQGPLSLRADLGPINFSGDPGLAATVDDQLGPIHLDLAPRGALAVQATVQMGQFSSSFPGLGHGSNGTFTGTIGQGPPGYLNVSDQLGPITVDSL